MLSKAELQNEIDALKSAPASWQNCERLAALYTIRRELFGNSELVRGPDALPKSPAVCSVIMGEYGNSEFLQAVCGKDAQTVFKVMDEIMDMLHMVNERAYNGYMRRLK